MPRDSLECLQLTPFMYKPHYEPNKPYLVYAVGCENPETARGSYFQGYFTCPHCESGNQFRFYDLTCDPNFLAKCPNVECNKLFIVVDDSEADDMEYEE